MSDLFLELSEWDLIPTQDGDIAVCEAPYSVAQAVANECKLFLGEAWYDTSQGVPYDPDILGAAPNIGLIEGLMQQAAMNVPGVMQARAVLYVDRSTRTLTGTVLVTTNGGTDLTVSV